MMKTLINKWCIIVYVTYTSSTLTYTNSFCKSYAFLK